jgi:hypothetical protein
LDANRLETWQQPGKKLYIVRTRPHNPLKLHLYADRLETVSPLAANGK